MDKPQPLPSRSPASAPRQEPPRQALGKDDRLDSLLSRLATSAGDGVLKSSPPMPSPAKSKPHGASLPTTPSFIPLIPADLKAAGLTEYEVVALVHKFLLKHGLASISGIATQIRLPFQIIQGIVGQLKSEQRLVYKNTGAMGDYHCELTASGSDHARRYFEQSSYCDAAPVPLHDYFESIRLQSPTRERPEKADLLRAVDGLIMRPSVVSRILQAMRAGRGMFLHGPPGNGKTSIAERITGAYGQHIWIPRAINIEGETVRLYDPCCHEELPFGDGEVAPKYDHRWIRIRRPTVIVGGELTMDRLEVTLNRSMRVCEAPVQMKSNCGSLVIDDFGRQRMPISELLNRWIIPLEKRYDYVNLPSGRTVQVPFDQLIIFSTNLEPRTVADEAFLRRIPYKIEIPNPTIEEFRELFHRATAAMGFSPAPDAVEYVISRHFLATERSLRFCHPRDLVQQAKCYCEVEHLPLKLTRESLDVAVENYFSVI